MWIDFGENVFQLGRCLDLITDSSGDIDEAKRRLWYTQVYMIINSIPLTILMSFIVVSLTYRTFINLADYIFRNKSSITKENITELSRDSCFCSICNVNDEHEIIYSKVDLDHVLDLFNKNNIYQTSEHKKELTDIDLEVINEKLNYCKIRRNKKETKLFKILDKIYKIETTFRFTSRYVNSVLVTVVALYYFFIYFGYSNFHIDFLSFLIIFFI